MLQKKKSKAVWQLKYVVLLPLVLGMLVYTSCENGKIPSDVTNNLNLSHDDKELIEKAKYKIEGFKKEYGDRWYPSFLKTEDVLLSKVGKTIDKESYFLMNLASREWLFEMDEKKPVKLNIRKQLSRMPSTKDYENYLNRIEVFKAADKNLKASFGQRSYRLQFIDNGNNYPENIQTIHVSNLRDLTGEEIKKVNRTLKVMENKEGSDQMVVRDSKYGLLVAEREYSNEMNRLLTSENREMDQQESKLSFVSVEEAPIFPGCEDAADKRACFVENVEKHIRKHFNYPKEALEMGIQGRVSLIFVIDANGAITDIRSRGPHELLEAEAERIINRLPAMLPGKQKGKAVDVPFSIPITFKL